MKHEITGDSQHRQTRLRLQSEKFSALLGAESAPAHQEEMQTITTAVDNLLKCTGFQGRARRNCFDYRLEKNEVYLPGLPPAFDGYTILHLSDLHADGLVDEGEGIMRIVETVPCDLAVMTGDFSSEEAGAHYEPCLEALAPIVRSISAQDGIFGVLGNHDLWEMVPELGRIGVQVLLNEAAQLRRGTADIVLAGVDDPHYYKCHDLKKALAAVAPDQVVILLSHSPEIAAEASRYGVDFYLCGHTHGGQICLPGGIALFANTSCIRSYVSGSWKCGTMQGYTSRGTGFSLAAARLFCPPEITLHTLHTGSLPCDFYGVIEENIGKLFNMTGHAVYA
ncbi:MAG: metallophosphoesterase [Desulfuromonadaceae bacterium]|nr:metallophosphoesterase [Desulfuromonadaceae bacterium]